MVRFFFMPSIWRPGLVLSYRFEVMGVYMGVSLNGIVVHWMSVMGLVMALVISLLQFSRGFGVLVGFLPLVLLCISTREIKTFSWWRLLQRSWCRQISQSRPQCHHFPFLFLATSSKKSSTSSTKSLKRILWWEKSGPSKKPSRSGVSSGRRSDSGVLAR